MLIQLQLIKNSMKIKTAFIQATPEISHLVNQKGLKLRLEKMVLMV